MLPQERAYHPTQPLSLRNPPNVSSYVPYFSQDHLTGFSLWRPLPGPSAMAEDFSAIKPAHAVPDSLHKAPSSAHAPPGLNPRSCVTCRRRKVKCDKRNPCSNCTRARIECIFPSPGRAPRKARKPPDGELMERLRKLESVVQSLGASVDDEPGGNFNDIDESRENALPPSAVDGHLGLPKNVSSQARKTSDGLESSFDRLVVNDGKTRYLNGNAWANLHSEVEDLKEILNEPSDDEEPEPYSSPGSNVSTQQSFLFGLSSSNVDMFTLHPPADLLPKYWNIFKDCVDPLAKILHIPTLEPKIFEARNRLMSLPRGLEALMFAIYYGVVTSLSNAECSQLLGGEKDTLLPQYRFGLEQALARAHFLDSPDLMVLQAFVLFITLIRRNDDARVIWTLTGLAVRIAHSIGIHRDGTHFNLSPFEAELRRRLWMQVVILDARASEDHGSDHTILESQFDSKIPRNVNDADLHPEMKELPESRKEFTIMTFCLIRFEIANMFRRIYYVPPNGVTSSSFYVNLTLEQKENWIKECRRRLEDTYLKRADPNNALFWVTTTMMRLVFNKVWLVVYHPYQRAETGLSKNIKDKLFLSSLESVECGNLLNSEQRTQRWQWLFKTYVQWHCLAFILAELCIRTRGEEVERAWRTLEQCVASRFPNPSAESRKITLWRPLRKLMLKARNAREQEVSRERAELQIQAQISGMPNPSTMAHGYAPHIESYPVIDALLAKTGSSQYENSPTPGASNNAPLNSSSPINGNSNTLHGNASPNTKMLEDFNQAPSIGMEWYIGGLPQDPLPMPAADGTEWWDEMAQQYGMSNMPVDRNGLVSVPHTGPLVMPVDERQMGAGMNPMPGGPVNPQGMGGWY